MTDCLRLHLLRCFKERLEFCSVLTQEINFFPLEILNVQGFYMIGVPTWMKYSSTWLTRLVWVLCSLVPSFGAFQCLWPICQRCKRRNKRKRQWNLSFPFGLTLRMLIKMYHVSGCPWAFVGMWSHFCKMTQWRCLEEKHAVNVCTGTRKGSL